jgi:hypothetical protein
MSNKDKMLKGLDELQKILKDVKSGKSRPRPPIDIRDTKGIEKAIKEISGMEMGGEVMDMTKSQPVDMMDGGKIKKMNMGGVVPGRGGKFKGMK